MIHRLALIVGSVAAAAIMALGYLATGLGPRAATVDAQQPSAAATGDIAAAAVSASVDQAPARPVTRVETTTVYVKPAPKPKVIHVTRQAPAATNRRPTKTVKVHTVHRAGASGGDDGGGAGGDD